MIVIYVVYLHPVIFLCIFFFFKIEIFYKMRLGLVLYPERIF